MRTHWGVLLVFSGCEGLIGGLGEGAGETSATCRPPPAPTALTRLTHAQYDNAIRDLLALDERPSRSFTPDPSFAGFDNNAEGMVVADRLGRDYRRAAEDLATRVIATPASRAAVVPCAGTSDACVEQFVSSFGRRAFRRPLSTEEQTRYVALFKQAPELVDAPDAFSGGVSLVVEAMLQSPEFLYRVEVELEQQPGGLAKLTPYQLASKLSFTLWNTTPDLALLDAAERGQLSNADGLRAQVTRLLDDPRARQAVDDFHAQWLDLARYRSVVRDPALFPAFTSTMTASMQEETTRFLRAVFLDEKRPFEALYRGDFTFVNAELARVYGLSGSFDASFTRVALDPAKRRGFLTQPGFLASHSYSRTDSPIHRGVFVIRRVLGQPQADPPPGVDFTLPPIDATIRTTRDQVTVKTSPRDCAGCHTAINGPGFAFGHYDALGQWRDTENGWDLDTTGSFYLANEKRSFGDALEMIDLIAASGEARRAYARSWFRYASQRADVEGDACEIDRLAAGLADQTRPMRELLGDLTQLPSFTLRSTETP